MNGYSKMRPYTTNKKTRSMDSLDLLSSPPTQETKPNSEPPKSDKPIAVVHNNNQNHHHSSAPEDAHPMNNYMVGAVKLMKTCSVAPTSSAKFRLERQSSSRRTTTTSGIQAAVKRVLSMRRSSSVSERYCRIYDQHDTLEPAAFDEDDEGDDDDEEATDNNAMKRTRSIKTKKKNGILKACKRLLGF